jgi:hypothetical protein
LSDEQLVARVKTYGQSCQESYGLYVRDLGLSPRISMDEFVKIWNRVSPDRQEGVETVPFRLTHYRILLAYGARGEAALIPAMVTTFTEHSVSYILDYGNGQSSIGCHPIDLFSQEFVPAEALTPFIPRRA